MTSELVNRLIGILNEKIIKYCLWKSNFALSYALAGETDLDLLVERRCLSQLTEILLNLGFKPAIVKRGQETPGVFHYYGFDLFKDRLIHVHLFTSILTGESLVKSHLLPLEQMLLENTEYIDQVRVPSKSAELVIFIIRIFIKYGSLPDLFFLQRSQDEIRKELLWLLSGADISATLSLLEKYLPVVDETLFVKCIKTLAESTSTFQRIKVAYHVRRRLHVYSRYSVFNSVRVNLQLLGARAWGYLWGNKEGKMMPSGGAIIAFVGPEATGKSTLVSVCGQWLGSAFTVKTVHAGKPPSSWLTAPINRLLPLLRRLLPGFRTTRLEGNAEAANPTQSLSKIKGWVSILYALSAVTVAWDRRSLLQKARRSAASGEIVICDRFPSEMIGAMDSPRLQEQSSLNRMLSSIYNTLTRLEHRLYAQIPSPDIVLRLSVSIETAKYRNRERIKASKESDAYIESRHRQSQKWYRSGTGCIYDIDTEQTEVQTVLCVKKAIWESL